MYLYCMKLNTLVTKLHGYFNLQFCSTPYYYPKCKTKQIVYSLYISYLIYLNITVKLLVTKEY